MSPQGPKASSAVFAVRFPTDTRLIWGWQLILSSRTIISTALPVTSWEEYIFLRNFLPVWASLWSIFLRVVNRSSEFIQCVLVPWILSLLFFVCLKRSGLIWRGWRRIRVTTDPRLDTHIFMLNMFMVTAAFELLIRVLQLDHRNKSRLTQRHVRH